jgi:hypothetical protein
MRDKIETDEKIIYGTSMGPLMNLSNSCFGPDLWSSSCIAGPGTRRTSPYSKGTRSYFNGRPLKKTNPRVICSNSLCDQRDLD